MYLEAQPKPAQLDASALAAPQGFLYAYTDTGLPGYRQADVDSNVVTLTEGWHVFPDLVAELDTAISAHGWAASWSEATGRVTLTTPGTGDLVWPDRLGHLLGFARPPGWDEGTLGATLLSRAVPPGAVWLQGATWDRVDLQYDQLRELYRWRRGYGYVWGQATTEIPSPPEVGARLWTWQLWLDRAGLEAARYGLVHRGRVRLTTAGASAMDGATPGGHLDGYVVHVHPPQAQDPTLGLWRQDVLIATSATP